MAQITSNSPPKTLVGGSNNVQLSTEIVQEATNKQKDWKSIKAKTANLQTMANESQPHTKKIAKILPTHEGTKHDINNF